MLTEIRTHFFAIPIPTQRAALPGDGVGLLAQLTRGHVVRMEDESGRPGAIRLDDLFTGPQTYLLQQHDNCVRSGRKHLVRRAFCRSSNHSAPPSEPKLGPMMAIDFTNLSVIDPAIRAELELVGGTALLARLYEMFINDSNQLLSTIGQALAAGDAAAVSHAAHRLKGGAAAVGAQRVAAVAKELEQSGLDHNVNNLAGTMAAMDAEMAAFRAASQA